MSNDLTQKLPGDKQPNTPEDDDRMSVLIGAVQSLSSDIQEVKVRIETLEKTINARSLETKPIWERALAEIAETRGELAETRAELKREIGEVRAELKREIGEVRAELTETRTELKREIGEVRAELAETRAELKREIGEVRAELMETRAELKAEMKDGFRKLGSKMEVLNEDLLTLRADQRLLDRRVESLESKTP